VNWGIVFATGREAAPFIELAGAGKISAEPFASWMFSLDAGRGVALVCGMGPDPAGKAAEFLITEHGAEAMINAGACAAAVDGIPVGKLFRVTESLEYEGKRFPCDAGRWEELPGARLATVAEPVHDTALRGAISRLAELIDMEGAAVARICAGHGVPVHLLKGVTDRADRTTGDSIRENLPVVATELARVLLEGLRR
jgi:nucleoside phosphorylase